MKIGVPKESLEKETRVSATPKTVEALLKLGYQVVIEHNAGARASFTDDAYVSAGATIGASDEVWSADILFKVNAPTEAEIARIRQGAYLVSLISPALHPDLLQKLSAQKITVLATDAVPRISRAQALDVLSSMANIAGYRAVVEAAHEFGSFFTGQVTAAGKVPPAKVLVAGAGVAGLAAIGTARSLGAIVRATDARPEVAEQVESMGADFLQVKTAQQSVSSDGYAKETSEDFNRAAAQLYSDQCKDVDIIITTALIPGKPAPRLINGEMVASMKPGSVIVDMAAANGGNVEGSVADQLITTTNGVRIIGYTDLAARLPTQASQLYSTNLVNLMKLITPSKDGCITLDFDDVVVRGMTVVHNGEVIWPPPPIQVSVTPAAPAAPVPTKPGNVTKTDASNNKTGKGRVIAFGVAVLAFLLVAWFSPAEFLASFTVFMLSCVIGYYVIGNVHHSLHTPLMSVTNAISGVIIIGALMQMGSGADLVVIIAAIAAFFASINVFGGFTVTQRMLNMFKKN